MLRRLALLGLFVMLLSFSSEPVLDAENFLKNPELKVVNGTVDGWVLAPKSLKVSNDDQSPPPGIASCLCIKVEGESKGDGQLLQIYYVNGDSPKKLTLSGYMKSQEPRCGYIQLKLYKDKKELKRENIDYTARQWEKFSYNFNVGDADKLEAICRWRYDDKYLGTDVCFADVRLEPISKVVAVVGDSTVQDCGEDGNRRGWGQMLPEFMCNDVAVANYAAGGRSSKTFHGEKHWEKVLAEKPDFVLIQFGHNDSHDKELSEATDAGGDFLDFMKSYVNEAKLAGIEPVLVTPPHRRTYEKSGELSSELRPYADAIKTVAKELSVPCIDLYAYSGKIFSERGDKSVELFCSIKDRSHFSEAGARLLAAYVAQELGRIEKTSALLKKQDRKNHD